MCLGLASVAGSAQAQEGLQPGEGYLTRFSGTKTNGDAIVIDTGGTVGSVIDLRNPAQPPRGHHWLNEPQAYPVTAAEVGQVFGIAIDGADQPNIYLTATSAFGLHRTADNAGWMAGMWGQNAGPATVWKLDGADDLSPSVFANITLDGRENTGAALGNIAYDKWNGQLYVSDLETGMIHRLSLDGEDLGHFDHGTEGRARFVDGLTGEELSLPEVAFDPNSAAQIKDCKEGSFAASPECWNFADFRRRVWGLGVRQDAETEEVRLYYAVWSSQALGSKDFASAGEDEKTNAVWSVAIADDGSFDTTSARREVFLPDFFSDPDDIARAGKSNPVSDIAFPDCIEQNVMLVAERSVRNLGLDTIEPFATPHESRVLRYELDEYGTWQPQGRYDVGFYDRKNEHEPYIRANSSGGVDFGYGYGAAWKIDIEKPDEFVWMTGDSICSPFSPCFVPDTGLFEDGSEVHGVQGTPEFAFEELLPETAMQPYSEIEEPYLATGPLQSWMIDADVNVDADGKVIMDSLAKNDATKIGDIEIYELCVGEGEPEGVEEGVVEEGEEPPVEGEVIEEELPPDVEYPPVIELPPIEDGPDLSKDKTGPAECIDGGICTFTITITNNGPGVWSGPLFEVDTLPPGAVLWDYAPQPDWVCNQPLGSDDVFCTHAWVTLLPGESVTLTIDVLLPFGLVGQVVENCVADVWIFSNDPADPDVILAVEQALFALGYVTGPVDGFLDIVTIAAITQYQIDNGLPVTGVIDDVLLASLFPGSAAAFGDLNPDNDWDCHEVTIVPAPLIGPAAPPVIAPGAPPVGGMGGGLPPDLEVTKDQLTAQCLPGGLCSFQIRFINRGPGDWTGFPTITDTLPAGATLVANSAWLCTQVGDTVTCQSPFETTLAPGESRVITLTVQMPANLQPGAVNCVDVVWPAGAAPDANPNNDRVCEPVIVGPAPEPDLWDPKVQATANCQPSGICSFDLWLVNRGPVSWTGEPRLEDDLPAGATLQGASDPWTCTQAGSTATCSRGEITLRSGQGTRVTVTVQLPPDAGPGTKNCVRIVQRKPDPVPQNDTFCIPVDISEAALPPIEPILPPADLSIEKRQVGTCKPGGICIFEIRVVNEGPGEWTGTPQVTDALIPGAIVSQTSPNSWACDADAEELTCVSVEELTLEEGQAVALVVSLRVPGNLESASNCAWLEPSEEGPVDPIEDNNEDCIEVTVTPEPTPAPTPIPPYQPHPPTPVTPPTDEVGPNVSCTIESVSHNGDWASSWHYNVTVILGSYKKCAVSVTSDSQPGGWIWCGFWFKDSAPTQVCGDLVNDPSFTGHKIRAVCNGATIIKACPPAPKAHKPPKPPYKPPHVPPPPPELVCPTGTHWSNGYCVAPIPIPIPIPHTGHCPPGTHLQYGHCVSRCPPGTIRKGHICIKPHKTHEPHQCRPGTHWNGEHCVTKTQGCPSGTRRVEGHCVKIQKTCPAGTHLKGGRCIKHQRPDAHVTKCPPGKVKHGSRCVTVQHCPKGTKRVGSKCVTVHQPVDKKKPPHKPAVTKKPPHKPAIKKPPHKPTVKKPPYKKKPAVKRPPAKKKPAARRPPAKKKPAVKRPPPRKPVKRPPPKRKPPPKKKR